MPNDQVDYSPPKDNTKLQGVKYSLPALLAELKIERTSSIFSKELLDQLEISKIFTERKKARERNKKS
ncbi:MAG: hypothetical protein JKY51_07960 [Opitutaceae bacterium]|nr:hypothetical protein [Opitutaceae bacterium]